MIEATPRTYVAIVDDDVGACTALARLLRAVGMRVDTFSSGEALLAVGPTWPYQCLIVDIRLGGISGLELQRYIGTDGNAPPVIMLSADDDPATREEARRQGAVAFFGKTDTGSDLIDAINREVRPAGAANMRWKVPSPNARA